MEYYYIDDISEKLRDGFMNSERLQTFFKYAKVYQTLYNGNNAEFPGGVEPGCTMEDIAKVVKKNLKKIQGEIATRIFPRPRLFLESGKYGYSLMQVAVIMSGDASHLIEQDDTFLWYQYVANMLEIEKMATVN